MPDLIKVAKFGGTSMADAKAMRRCAEIIAKDPDKKIIVVSATSGTTNLLTQICESQIDIEKEQLLKEIRSKHLAICEDLENANEVRPELIAMLDDLGYFASLANSAEAHIQDEILSFGEKLSSTLFTEILKEKVGNAKWVDARNVMITDDIHGNAEPNIEQVARQAKEQWLPLFKNHCLVTQGFIGSTEKRKTTTLGRGGSDYSAALFAEAIEADVLEIWTDVSAVYTTDPRIVKDARPITEISFDEAAELSVFGAKVLHPATLKPAIRKRIKVYVGSSINPEQPGTWIVKETKTNPVIRAISLRRKQTLLNVHSLDMLHRSGFLARLFEVLAKYKISVDLVTTSEVSVSLTLDTDIQSTEKNKLTTEVIDELRNFSEVTIDRNLSLIALVGNNLHATAGLSGPVFGALQDINIRLICHGASSHNLCFLVREDQAENVVQILHEKFITSKTN
ncbi:MAG: lysine-sensitive aspartokinase 3 [Balneolaceae bacterium]